MRGAPGVTADGKPPFIICALCCWVAIAQLLVDRPGVPLIAPGRVVGELSTAAAGGKNAVPWLATHRLISILVDEASKRISKSVTVIVPRDDCGRHHR